MGKENEKETSKKVDEILTGAFTPPPTSESDECEAKLIVGMVLASPTLARIPTDELTLYALSPSLTAVATPENFASIGTYLLRLHDAGLTEFAVLAIRDIVKAKKEIVNTPAFVYLVTVRSKDSRSLGEYICGANFEPPTQTGSGV